MEEEKKVTEYLIPANVNAKFEFFEGFGWHEFFIVLIALVIGLIFFFLTGLITHTIEIDPNELSFEKRIGLNENDLKLNENGMIEEKRQVIPTTIRVLFFIIIPGAGTFFLVRKDPINGMSLLFMIKSYKQFQNKQKRYLYIHNSANRE